MTEKSGARKPGLLEVLRRIFRVKLTVCAPRRLTVRVQLFVVFHGGGIRARWKAGVAAFLLHLANIGPGRPSAGCAKARFLPVSGRSCTNALAIARGNPLEVRTP